MIALKLGDAPSRGVSCTIRSISLTRVTGWASGRRRRCPSATRGAAGVVASRLLAALARPIAFSSPILPIRCAFDLGSALDRAFIVARPMTRIPRSSSPSLSEPDSSSEGDSPRTRNPGTRWSTAGPGVVVTPVPPESRAVTPPRASPGRRRARGCTPRARPAPARCQTRPRPRVRRIDAARIPRGDAQ